MRQTLARAIRKVARVSGGRPVQAANLHVTLAVLDSGQAAPLPGETSGIEVTFDHLEYWRAAQLLCAVPAELPARAAALAGRLQVLLTESGFAPDLKSSWSIRFAIAGQFRPHVTLVRKVDHPPRVMEMHPVTWSFADFVLVDSKTLPAGPVYTVLERFLLLDY